jgi:hypothetical protein
VIESIKESYALATAYRDFLSNEVRKSRYKQDGTEYESLTRRVEWNQIIISIYDLLSSHMISCQTQPKPKLLHGDTKNIIQLITKLLAAEYPWCWGDEQEPNAEKIVKERIYRLAAK